MDPVSDGWWRRHGWTIALLLTAFGISFAIRTVWSYPIVAQYGALFTYGGGSDSYYHSRVMAYIIQNHVNLIHDPMLKFPVGSINPREPLFDWMNAILGILFAPFFGGNAVAAGAWFLDLQAPLWAALGVFPVYLIGREVASRRMGLIAALIFPFLSANIDSTIFGYANYLSFYTFIILVVIYSYIRTVKSVGSRRWVESYRDPRSVLAGLKGFLRVERTAVKWAVFTGVSLGALALAWQGYTYAVVVIGVSVLVIMIVERIRRVDSFGLYVATWIVGLVGFPMAVPYYLVQQQFSVWFDLPLLLFFGVLGLLLPFLFLRDVPWVFSIPLFAGLVALAALGLRLVNPGYFTQLVTGQGYFVKTLIYSTVAEAQAPSFDALVISYGILTFFLAFVGLGLFVLNLARKRFRREHALFVVFAIVSIYLPISAAKFFYLGSPAFTLLPAEALLIILDIAGYAQLRRTAASLSGARGQFTAVRRAFKARHVLVLLLIVVLLVPNVWYAVDAGIPYNTKAGYSSQVYDTLPTFLRTAPSNASSYYLGASGTELDSPNQYDEAGYNWLATQDSNLAPASRPAFVSWWDYGFQAIAEGQHPSVADNFQNGIDAAGNFLLAQNESLAIGILTVTLLQAEQSASGYAYLPPQLNAILASDGVDLSELHTLLVNTSADLKLVEDNPQRYLPVNPATLTATNAMFDAVSWFLADTLTESGVAQVYNDVQAYTGWSIRYAMVDDRLYPFSGTDTGIFYAPADLTGRVIGADGAPTTYFSILAVGSNGAEYPVNEVPSGVTVVNYALNQLAPFYNSMIYRIYMGYNGTDIGLSAGIPGLQGSLTSYTPEPGWMLQHFEVAYRTAYYSPTHTNSTSACDLATNLPDAAALAAKTNGTPNTGVSCYFNGGEAVLEYYAGEPLGGTVTLPDGTPVSGARLTVYDSWGIPHQSVLSSSDGSFSIILPPGNDTLNVTSGPLQGLRQNGTELLTSLHLDVNPALGFSFDAPPISQSIVLQPGTVNGFVFWNSTANATYNPQQDVVAAGANVTLNGSGMHVYRATTDVGGSFKLVNVAPGVYNFTVRAAGTNFAEGDVVVSPGQAVNATAGLVPSKLNGTVRLESGQGQPGATVTISTSTGLVDTTTTNVTGGFQFANLVPGNYSLKAQYGVNLAANSTALSLNQTARVVTENLTLIPVVPVDFEVEASGAPVSGFIVRMTPIRETSGSASGQAPSPSAALVFTTDSTGYVHANVPAGNYSIYGYGPVGSTFLAGFESAYLPSTGQRIAVAPLELYPPVRLSGQSSLPSGVTSADVSATEVSLYDSAGNQLTLFANSSGAWSVLAPAGNYSIQALAVGVSTSTDNYTAVGYVDLTSPTSISLPLTSAFRFAMSLGASTPPSATFYPAEAAEVHLTVQPTGATISTLTDQNGAASFLLPAAQPGTTYCLTTRAIGFGGYQACDLSVGELSSLSRVVVPLLNDTVNVTVTGLPSGATLRLNATAIASPAQSRTISGGATFSVSLAPGPYTFTAWAPPPSGTGVYLPPQSINLTLPLGSSGVTLAIQLFHQVTSKGLLTLPTGVAPSAVKLKVYAPPFNFSLTGTTFTTGFLVAPGSYSVYGSAVVSGANYSSLTVVTVNATGVVTPAIALQSGVTLTATLVGPNGARVNVTAPVYWTGPDGSQLYSVAVDGVVSLTLPGGASYVPYLNVTTTTTASGVLRYAIYTVASGTSCSVGTGASTCSIPLNVVYLSAGLTGQFYWNGGPLTLSGTVRLMGPYPSTNVTVVTTTNGAFNATVLPGVYSLYATAGSGAGVLAAVTQVTVPFPSTSITLPLSPAWTDTLTATVPAGLPSSPTANVTWTSASGSSWTASGVALGAPLAFVLPQGIWTVSVNGTVFTYGRPVVAFANASATLVTGNQATNLVLVPEYTRAVALATRSPDSVTVPMGGSATFSFVVQNTGNVPVTIQFYGDPASWNFTFSPATLTLGVGAGNSTGGGTVRIIVPNGTATNHGPVVLGAVLVSNTSRVVGTAVPAPTVNIVPVPAISVTRSSVGASVTPQSATVNFNVQNTGNTPFSAAVSVVNTVQLAQLGWAVVVNQGQTAVSGPVSFAPGQLIGFSVVLSTKGFAQPPGTIVVEAVDLNSSGAVVSSIDLPVPIASVSSPHGLSLSGPNVGAPPALPGWGWTVIAVLPAIALLALLFTVRWWRTRRWLRR